ncbi:MAG: hypothetical protein KAJ19_27430 [Gammaproteobacteria bacterium]|nr:hypothetical protein [Gammaproteobacteria bacterium]
MIMNWSKAELAQIYSSASNYLLERWTGFGLAPEPEALAEMDPCDFCADDYCGHLDGCDGDEAIPINQSIIRNFNGNGGKQC